MGGRAEAGGEKARGKGRVTAGVTRPRPGRRHDHRASQVEANRCGCRLDAAYLVTFVVCPQDGSLGQRTMDELDAYGALADSGGDPLDTP
jgi:hypothetical protein